MSRYINVNDSIIKNNTISGFGGMTGGAGEYYDSGGSGGTAPGIYLSSSTNNTLTSNAISTLTAGAGGTSGDCGSGGSGGTASGIHLSSSTNNTLTSNAISTMTAGAGGASAGYKSGGSGGTASGIHLSSSTNNTLTSNAISTLTAGAGGAGGYRSSGGSGGTASGIWLDTNSHDNTITLTESQGSYHIPNSSELNTIEGKPILYFYNKANLNISHFNVTVSTIPILIGGSTQTGRTGGAGGKSTGIALINVNDSIIKNNTISGFGGMTGGTGEKSGSGGSGGTASGVYLSSSTNNTLTSNAISTLTAGAGSTGGTYGPGGSGGTVSGIHLSSSTNNTLTSNAISTLTAGTGGIGGYYSSYYGSGGSGGTASGIWLGTNSHDNTITLTESQGSYHIPDSSELNTIEGKPILYFYNKTNLNISHFNVTVSTIPILIGGSTQTGEQYSSGGSGGKSTGIALINVNDSIIKNNTISGFGGMTGGTGGYDGPGGSGGTTSGVYLSSSTNNTLTSNAISTLTAGAGGAGGGGYGGSGGSGGTSASIYLYSAELNLIYNNLFNNTNNFHFAGTTYTNYWNTTKQTGARIYSNGTQIGGNYWTNPTGNGYSDTCVDSDEDGFCDLNYTLNSNNIDYLPLSSGWTPPVHNLDTELNYTTIQAAIDDTNTTDGHTLTVDPGTYRENVRVTKSLTIRATSGDSANTVVNASDAEKHVFNLTADGVNLSGFGIENATGAGKAGVHFESGVTNCNVTNNNVKSNYYGVSLSGASGNNISCNRVHHNTEAGFYLTGGSTGNTIEQNNIVTNGNYNSASEGYEWQFANNQSNDVSTADNWWGTNNETIINASIYDWTYDTAWGNVTAAPRLDGASPCAPVPELPTVLLFAVGLIMLAGYVTMRKGKNA